MKLTLSNHSSYPRIGDTADLQLLRRTITQRDKGTMKDENVHAAEDRMTELALSEQIEAGLDIVTDGQIRWYDPVSHLAAKLAGVQINGLLRFFDTNFYFRQPVVESPPRRTQPLLVEEFTFAKAKSSRPVKAVVTGPYTLARLSLEQNGRPHGFEKRLKSYATALAEEVSALAEAGADWIQVEEPSLLRCPEDFPRVEEGLKALAQHKGAARLALTTYFGDAAPLYEKLQTLPVEMIGLDFTYNPGLADVIAFAGSSKTLGLGLVDGRNTKLEEPAAVARQLERIARGPGVQEAHLTTSCGLEYLPRDRAQLKLKHLVTLKNTFAGSGE